MPSTQSGTRVPEPTGQPVCTLIQAGEWLHVVLEYTTPTQPATCANASTYPGAINIWVNGVEWTRHGDTGCMSQYGAIPVANNSPLNIGTMAYDDWFKSAMGKVAIYNYLLSQVQINKSFRHHDRSAADWQLWH